MSELEDKLQELITEYLGKSLSPETLSLIYRLTLEKQQTNN